MRVVAEKLFANLYDDYFDDVYRFVITKTGNKWDADDIVSESFRKAYENSDKLENVSSPKAWLFTIARNTIYDYYRRKHKVILTEEMEIYTEPITFKDTLELSDEMECLKKSLAHLP